MSYYFDSSIKASMYPHKEPDGTYVLRTVHRKKGAAVTSQMLKNVR